MHDGTDLDESQLDNANFTMASVQKKNPAISLATTPRSARAAVLEMSTPSGSAILSAADVGFSAARPHQHTVVAVEVTDQANHAVHHWSLGKFK